MPVGFDFYDQEHDAPAQRGNVVDLWAADEDWDFPTYGALALQPDPVEPPEEEPSARKERPFRLKALASFVTVPRMATTEAPGFAARARQRQREEARAKARRARRTAALVVVACGCLVALLLTAFGRGGETTVTITGPAPASRLLPAGPPRPQIVAMQDSLRIQLPVNQSRVTAIGYHATGTQAPSRSSRSAPRRTPACAQRLFRRLFGSDSGSEVRYFLLEGGVGAGHRRPRRRRAGGHGRVRTGRRQRHRHHGQHRQRPGLRRADRHPAVRLARVVVTSDEPAARPGADGRLHRLVARRRRSARIIDLSEVERAGLARYTQDNGPARAHRGAPRHSPDEPLIRRSTAEAPLRRRRVRPARRRRAVDGPAARAAHELDVDFCVVNGENAADGIGLTAKLAAADPRGGRRRDHDREPRLAPPRPRPHARVRPVGVLRPANFGERRDPRQGSPIADARDGTAVAVLNLQGQLFLQTPMPSVPRRRRARRGGARADAGRPRRLPRRGDEREDRPRPHARRPRHRRDRHAHPRADERRPRPPRRHGRDHRRGHDRPARLGDRRPGRARNRADAHRDAGAVPPGRRRRAHRGRCSSSAAPTDALRAASRCACPCRSDGEHDRQRHEQRRCGRGRASRTGCRSTMSQ